MTSSLTADADVVSVVHRIPGRLRVRIPTAARAEGLVDAIRAVPGVRAVTWSPRTRSLLVLHDVDADADTIVSRIAEHAGVESVAIAPQTGRPTLAGAVTSVFGETDARVARASRGLLTLGTLVPLVLIMWAGREILRGRAAPLAWSSALWYAHGMFRDYNRASQDD
jgi:heavy-metal-associated domain-containing protein